MLTTVSRDSAMKLSFPQWLKLMRDRANLSQREIAEALDVKVQTVGNWEGGRSVPKLTPDQTYRLCELLGVSLASLANGFQGEAELGDRD